MSMGIKASEKPIWFSPSIFFIEKMRICKISCFVFPLLFASAQACDQEEELQGSSVFGVSKQRMVSGVLGGLLCLGAMAKFAINRCKKIQVPAQKINRDIALNIASSLSPEELMVCMAVCKKWKNSFDDPLVWQRICQTVLSVTPRERYKEYFFTHFGINLGYYAKQDLLKQCSWDSGPTSGNFQIVSEEILVIGDLDGKIKKWDLRTGKCIGSFEEPSETTNFLKVIGNKLIQCAFTSEIRVWDFSTGEPLFLLKNANMDVACWNATENCLIAGHYNGNIKVIDLDIDLKKLSDCCIYGGHTQLVTSLKTIGNNCFSSSYDGSVLWWDLSVKKQIYVFEGHRSQITCLQYSNTKIAVGFYDGTIQMWRIHAGYTENICHPKAHPQKVTCLEIVKNILASGSTDGTIKIWNLVDLTCIRTLNSIHGITFLKLIGNTLISSSEDGTIKIWNIHNNEPLRIFEGEKTRQVKCLEVSGTTIFCSFKDGLVNIYYVPRD